LISFISSYWSNFVALKSFAPEDSPVFLDIPEANAAAVDLVNRHGMTVVFETARMYMGKRPDLSLTGFSV
jgi:Acetyltransferase (GNAT) domain